MKLINHIFIIEYKSLNIELKLYKKGKSFIILILFIICISSFIFIKDYQNINSHEFARFLPKVSMHNNTVPSFNDILNSRTLFISENLTEEYIRYIRPINKKEDKKYRQKYSENEIKIYSDIFKKRSNQYNYQDFAKICLEERLIDLNKFEYDKKPLISIILPSFNKERMIMKSIRSIQNQSFKNIEIILVNDCSIDKSNRYFKYLLKTDPRIRIFTHLKNMGLWRTRLDGILYSRGKYIISFDTGDLYEDNFVLEDAYNLMEKYNLDSVKFLFRLVSSFNSLDKTNILFHVYNNSKIIYGSSNIEKYDKFIFNLWGNIWNRLVRANILIKGLYLLNDLTLNIYKNVWEDAWYNTIINKVSYSFLVIERVGYIYLQDGTGYGTPKSKTENQKDKIIKEYLGFLYFEYNMLPENNNKKIIIKKLQEYNSTNSTTTLHLRYLKTEFHTLYNLLNLLIEDSYVSKDDKIFLNKLLIEFKKKEKNRILFLIKKIFNFL